MRHFLALATICSPLFLACTHCEDCDGDLVDAPTTYYSYVNRSPWRIELALVSAQGDTIAPRLSLAPRESVSYVGSSAFAYGPTDVARITLGPTDSACVLFSGSIRDSALDPRIATAYHRDPTGYTYLFTDVLAGKAIICE